MATADITIQYIWIVNGQPTDATTAKLSDPTATFGLRHVQSGTVIVPDDTDMVRVDVGTYEYTVELSLGEEYQYYVEIFWDFQTTWIERKIIPAEAAELIKLIIVKDGSAVEADSIPLVSAPTSNYGMIRLDNGEVVIPDNTPYTLTGELYSAAYVPPESGLKYRYYAEVVLDGETFHLPRTTYYTQHAALVKGRYTDSHKIETAFGVDNVHKWLGIDEGDEPTDWAFRMYQRIVEAEAELDNRCRGGPVAIPFTVSPTVTYIATTLAGVHIYEARGVVDLNVEDDAPLHRLVYHRNNAHQQIASIMAGRLRLPGDSITRHPIFQDIGTDYDTSSRGTTGWTPGEC